jgi:hypothetical protein
MLRRRIIPCLDVSGGRVVKGVEFVNLRDCGEPVDAALRYAAQGADELCWLNITAGDEAWDELLTQVADAGTRIDVPLTVGGGVSDEPHVRDLLGAGADTVSINSAALDRPALVTECAERHGSQCIVVAIDARRTGSSWEAVASGGRRTTGRDAVEWAQESVERGAGELASRSRGTPRIANRLLKRARDYAQVKADGVISHEVADAALKMMEVDRVGLDSLDRLYLTTLIDRFDGGPTGAETMAATLRLERDTIEDVLEPFLMMAGFLQRTPRGRTATRRAYEHLGRRIPKSRSSDTQPGLLELES